MIKLSPLFTDGMIIERNAKIWGQADAGEPVVMSFRQKTYEAAADDTGRFEIEFDAGPYGGPHEITIGGVTIKDVLVGYVWLCGGQSNMETPVSRVRRTLKDDFSDVNFKDIRAFVIEKAFDFSKEAARLSSGSWKEAVNENINEFYAVPYFFARSIYKKYGIPVGLICCAAGGTAAESWLPKQALSQFPKYLSILNEWENRDRVSHAQLLDEKNAREWFKELDENDMGVKGSWEKIDFDDSSWNERELLENFEYDLHINGSVWFRKTVQIPEGAEGLPAVLSMGRVVDSDYIYVNGEFAGRVEYKYPPSVFDLKPGVLRAGENVIAVRVISSNGMGGFVKDKSYEISLGGDTKISLLGKWRYKIGCVSREAPIGTYFHHLPAGYYNAMLAPVIGYPITGAVWYQGETNAGYPEDYSKLMEAVINEWRGKWGWDFPFIVTLLANFDASLEGYYAPYPRSLWAELRDGQLKCLSLPKTAAASAIDCGEHNDIHPMDKKTVGERLALAAMAIAYGEDMVYQGPAAREAVFENGKIIITFDRAELVSKTGKDPGRFEIETTQGGCLKARARIQNGAVVIDWEAEPAPEYVRYAWADNPKADLYNPENLPAAPFRLKIKQS